MFPSETSLDGRVWKAISERPRSFAQIAAGLPAVGWRELEASLSRLVQIGAVAVTAGRYWPRHQVQAAIERSHALDSDANIPAPAGLEYLGYQRAGIAFAAARRGTLIADEMGLGKTVQAIGVINADPTISSVLVVCPKSVKLNWKKELDKWLTRDLVVDLYPENAQVTICNYEQLKKIGAVAVDLLIVDEAHACKNDKAQRTKAVREIAKKAKRVVMLTGTPILNKPIELFPLLSMLDPLTWDPAGVSRGKRVEPGEGGGFFRYAKRYCNAHQEYFGKKSVWNFDGASNLPELQEKLRASVMVRRLKSEVLAELLPKRRQVIALETKTKSADFDASGDFETVTTRARQVPFEEMSRVRHDEAVGKVDAAADFLRETLESSPKVVVFAHHRDVISALAAELAAFGVVAVTGETADHDRQAAVEAFQTNPACRVFLGSIAAAGVGLTLTASSHVVFVELDWTPALVTQAEDRCHRIGQRESVLVQHLVVKGSLDEKICELLVAKQQIADLALDTETVLDVSGRPLVESIETRRARSLSEIGMTESDVERVHQQLRFLASRCDGAREQDGAGFNQLDSAFGRELASLERLSVRQAVAARKLLVKYHGQLGES